MIIKLPILGELTISKSAGLIGAGVAFYLVTQGVNLGLMNVTVATQADVEQVLGKHSETPHPVTDSRLEALEDIASRAVETQSVMLGQLDVIESQGIERQLSGVVDFRCANPNGERFDDVWNSLRQRFEAKRGQIFEYPSCAQ